MTTPAHGAIRQTATGMEGYCYLCQRRGEPLADCWWPLTEEFFPVKHRGMTRLIQFERFCKACNRERRAVDEARCRQRKQQQEAA